MLSNIRCFAVFSAEDRILIENVYKINLMVSYLKKLIHEFSDNGWNVRSSNRLLKKLLDSVADVKQHLIAAWCGH